MPPPTEDNAARSEATPRPARSHVKVRLRRSERIAGAAFLISLGVFYGGPVVLRSVFDRRAPEPAARATAVSLLAPDGSGEIVHIDLSYRRRQAPTLFESVTAAGPWLVSATATVKQRADLFAPDDFATHARKRRDDSPEVEAAVRLAASLPSKAGLPSLPHPPPLFVRAAAAGEEARVSVEYDVERVARGWRDPAPVSAWRCWSELLDGESDWQFSVTRSPIGSRATKKPTAVTREQLPSGAVVVGDPAFERSLDAYLSARAGYAAAAKGAFERHKLAALNEEVRAELVRQVGQKFYPTSGWMVELVEPVSALDRRGDDFGATLRVTARRTKALYREASAEESARTMAPTPDFESARKSAEQFFPALATDWPKAPKLFVVAKASGVAVDAAVSVRARDGGSTWTLLELDWSAAEIPVQGPGSEVLAADVEGDVAFDGDSSGLSTPADWKRVQSEAVSEVRAAEKQLADRYGEDRAAWHALLKMFKAAGGRDRLESVGGFTERVKVALQWPWLLGTKQDAEASGRIEWRTRPFAAEEHLDVHFRFKPLLASAYTVAFTSVTVTDASKRHSETKDAYTLSGSERSSLQGSKEFSPPAAHRALLTFAYAEHLLWQLAADDARFEVKARGNSTLTVRADRHPLFTVEVDPATSAVKSVAYTDTEGDKPNAVRMEFGAHREFGGITFPTRRETFVNGKRERLYEVTNVTTTTAPIAPTGAGKRPNSVPSASRIKADLVGYSIGRGYASWRFDSASEFRRFTIKAKHDAGLSVTYDIQISLVGKNGIRAKADIAVSYDLRNGAWVLSRVDDKGTYQREY